MKLLYIDHKYHLKTNSSLFIINLLKKRFDVTILYIDPESSIEVELKSINVHAFDAMVLFQIGESEIGKSIFHRNLVFIPMYDNSGLGNSATWERISDSKIISFSKVFHDHITSLGNNSYYAKYYPIPQGDKGSRPKNNSLFFWQRTNAIDWNTIKLLIGNHNLESIHLHRAVDPGQRFIAPTDYERKSYNITFSDWFERNDDYVNIIAKSKYYIAPRLSEGIGMSFLEAMALGAVVIAANRPTMNEYITSGENGILFEPLAPSMIDFDKIGNISENAKDSIAEGRRKWDEKEEELLDFIASPPTIRRLRKNTEIRRMRPFPVFIGVLKRLGLLKILKLLLPYGLVAYLKRKK